MPVSSAASDGEGADQKNRVLGQGQVSPSVLPGTCTRPVGGGNLHALCPLLPF